jgi:hypothetical protein
MDKFIISNGCALRITDTRKGDKTIFLLHGYLESLDVWEDFTKLLSKEYRVVAMDIPGHGISQVMGEKHSMSFLADTVVGVLDELEIEKATIVEVEKPIDKPDTWWEQTQKKGFWTMLIIFAILVLWHRLKGKISILK